MSESRTVYPTHAAGIRSRALDLLRQCWKPLLIAALIASLFAWASAWLTHLGEEAAAAASDAALTAFRADAPAEDTPEYIEWAYFNEYAMEDAAEEAANRASLPWEAASLGVDLLGWVVGVFVLLGLHRGLLRALRGGECTAADLLGGRRSYGRALWTDVVVFLRAFGWALLAMIPLFILTAALQSIGAILGLTGLIIFAIWLSLRYCLVEIHLADDAEGAFSASDYIRHSVEDVKFFSIMRLIGVLWPFWLASLALGMPAIIAEFVPALALPALIIELPVSILINMVSPALIVCIYEAVRIDLNAPDPRQSEGAVRARALASGEEGEA